MSKYLFITFLITVNFQLIAQEDIFPKLGKFTQEEFDQVALDLDPDASAIVLFDYGKAHFINQDNGLVIRFVRHTRIKILKESGLHQANISIPYYRASASSMEQILDIKASSNNLRGYEIETQFVDKKSIFEEKTNEYWRQKRFSIPGVKVGSIIEISYSHITPYMFNLADWEFQRDIPTLKSQFEVSMVPFYEYVFVAKGDKKNLKHTYKKVGIERSYANVRFNDIIHKFSMENIEAFYDDEFIASRDDYIKKIDFQLSKINYPNGSSKDVMTNYEDMAKELLSHQDFGKYIKSVKKTATKETLPEMNLTGLKDTEKIQTIRNFVSNQFKLNDFYGKYAMQKPRELENEKLGSIADINLYLIGLLRAAEFHVTPLILSTRAHGKVYREYPISDRFNYVIALVQLEKGQLFIDATEPSLPYYLPPSRCLNGWGLAVKEKPEWINVYSPYYSKKTQVNTIQFKNDKLITSVKENSTHYDANKERYGFENHKEDFLSKKLNSDESFLKAPEALNSDKHETSFNLKYSKTRPVEHFESEIYVNPFQNFEFGSNPLAQKKRDYPVDFVYKRERNFQTTIFIPDSLSIKSIPNKANLSNSLVDFDYAVNLLSPSTIQLVASYKLKKSIYEPEDFDLLKRNLKYITTILNKQIVLSKEGD